MDVQGKTGGVRLDAHSVTIRRRSLLGRGLRGRRRDVCVPLSEIRAIQLTPGSRTEQGTFRLVVAETDHRLSEANEAIVAFHHRQNDTFEVLATSVAPAILKQGVPAADRPRPALA